MKITKHILTSLRGRQSARAFSQKLQYKSNQISRWESGHSRITWNDFLDLTERLKLPMASVLQDLEFHGDPRDIKAIFHYLLPGRKSKDIAKICEVSVLTVQRWQSKKISPPADALFKLFTFSGAPLVTFVRKLLQTKKASPQLEKILDQEQSRLSVMMESPWTIAIACLSLLTPIKGLSLDKSIGQISKQIRLEESQVRDVIARLLRTKLLGFDQDKQQFYLSEGPAHFEFRDSYESFISGVKFWTQFSKNMVDGKKTEARGENHMSYLIFNCASEEVKRIHEKIIALYKELSDIGQNQGKSLSPDRTFAFCMHLYNINNPVLGRSIQQWED